MRVPHASEMFPAAVITTSLSRSVAFAFVAPTAVFPPAAQQRQQEHATMASSRTISLFHGSRGSSQAPEARRHFLMSWGCGRPVSRRTRLSAQLDGMYPDGVPNLPGMKTIVETEEEEEQRAIREWKDDGRKGRVLVRRKEIPSPELDAVSVCQLVLQSLQNNDDPMLDYGAAVAIKFASSKNVVKGMTPVEYGTFLRNHPEQGLLIDNASCAPAERAKVSPDGNQVLQKVEINGRYPENVKRILDVQLSKDEDGCWRVDALILGPPVGDRK